MLKGSYVFMADLTRKIDTACNVDFMVVSSYGQGTKTSGEVQIIKDIGQKIEGRDLIIVEDILDSGVTLSYLMKVLQARGANSIRLCTLLSKPERHGWKFPSIILALKSLTNLLWGMAWIMRKNTAICRISAF